MNRATNIKPILVATDTGARCDRVVERAVLLANAWGAELVAVHVLPENTELRAQRKPRKIDPREAARRCLADDLADATGKVTLVVADGTPVEAVARIAKEHDCGLILTGVAREETVGEILLGDTVDALARRSTLPLLVVKNRVRQPYRNLVAATDFSPASRHALEVALAWFQPERLTVVHGYAPPPAKKGEDQAAHSRHHRSAVAKECNAFLADLPLADQLRQELTVVLEEAYPGDLLRDHVQEHPSDLVVVASHGQSALRDIVLGSTAKEILSAVPCDTLLVRAPA